MNNRFKLDYRFARPILIALVFILIITLAYLGFHKLNKGQSFLEISGSIYSVFSLFLFSKDATKFENWEIAIAAFLAGSLVGYGIFIAAYRVVYHQWILIKIYSKYRGHTIIFGINKIGFRIASELLKAGEQVVAIETNEKNDNITKIRQQGGLVLLGTEHEETDLMDAGIQYASNCLILKNDEESNLQTANLISYMNQKGEIKSTLRVQTRVDDWYKYNFLKDYMDQYNKTENFNIDPLSAALAAAQIIFDTYSPLKNVIYKVLQSEDDKILKIESSDNAIAIVGFTETAKSFIIENIILSHSPGIRNLKIILIAQEVDKVVKELRFAIPFINDIVDLIPYELENENFYGSAFSSDIFVDLAQKLSGVYFFGEHDSKLISLANSFRQTLYAQIGDLKEIPLVVCLPEESKVLDLLEPNVIQSEGTDTPLFDMLQENFNINIVRLITDTITKGKLIDEIGEIDAISKAINYFYSMKYEFEWLMNDEDRALYQPAIEKVEHIFLTLKFTTEVPVLELQNAVLGEVAKVLNKKKEDLEDLLGVEARWNSLSDLKQESNRYVARHLQIKVEFLRKMGHDPNNLDRMVIEKYFKVFAPIEHKRWCSEKLCFKFKYGPFPKDKKIKKLLKDTLKTHDQIIPYNDLDQEMEDKDFNMFLLIPVLQGIKSIMQVRD